MFTEGILIFCAVTDVMGDPKLYGIGLVLPTYNVSNFSDSYKYKENK